MGKTFDSFKREIGKNTGKAVSNFFFGDSHATPYRRVGSSEVHQARAEAQQTRAYTERERVRAQIEKQEQDDLNILDGAVLKNVDIVLQTPIPQDEAGLLNLMSIWAAQLEMPIGILTTRRVKSVHNTLMPFSRNSTNVSS
ncbi:MAG: hypothetical protein IKP36_06180 [Bacteroidaceae bacterium]|nr:hypothetical protein [Bacteroidaceae bacterium]